MEDDQIYNDINTLYGGNIEMPEGMILSHSKDLLQKKNTKPTNNNKQQKNNKKQFYKNTTTKIINLKLLGMLVTLIFGEIKGIGKP